MKEILFISAHAEAKTGAHYRFDRLVRHASANSKSCYWLTPPRHDIKWQSSVKKIETAYDFRKKFAYVRYFFSALLSFGAISKLRGKIDVIVVFGEHTLTVALLCKVLTGAKLSVGVRSNVLRRYEIRKANYAGVGLFLYKLHFWLKTIFLKFAYCSSDQIVVQSEEAMRIFSSQYKLPSTDLVCIHNNVPKLPDGLRVAVQQRAYKDRPVSLLFVGNSSDIKGLDLFLDACCLLDSKTSIRNIFIVGVEASHLNNSMRNVCFSISKRFSLKLLGYCGDVSDHMLSCDLLVVPSREDQFPNVVLEAMSVNLPVIGSDVDGIKLMLLHRELLFQAGNVESLRDVIESVSSKEGYSKAVTLLMTRKNHFDFPWEDKYLSMLPNSVGRVI